MSDMKNKDLQELREHIPRPRLDVSRRGSSEKSDGGKNDSNSSSEKNPRAKL